MPSNQAILNNVKVSDWVRSGETMRFRIVIETQHSNMWATHLERQDRNNADSSWTESAKYYGHYDMTREEAEIDYAQRLKELKRDNR